MLDSADKALNDAYKALLAKIGPDGKETLKEAQRAWIQFRDADTALAYQIPAKEVPLAGLSPQNTKLI